MTTVELPAGTLLGGNFLVESVLGVGGFGITYAGVDLQLDRRVAIKEYFPRELAYRSGASVRRISGPQGELLAWGRSRFVQEAQTLARFRHPNIVRVIKFFEANETAYMVLEFEEGQRLDQWARGLGRLPGQDEIDRLAEELLGALAEVHAGSMLHRDIAPDNVMMRADGSAVLIDFGSARIAVGERSQQLSSIVKARYSPPEQYQTSPGSHQGPWTDIYALAATFYQLVIGQAPPSSVDRMIEDSLEPAVRAGRGAYRTSMLAAIDHGLKLRPAERPQSIAAWREDFFRGEVRSVPLTGRRTGPTSPQQAPSATTPRPAAVNARPVTARPVTAPQTVREAEASSPAPSAPQPTSAPPSSAPPAPTPPSGQSGTAGSGSGFAKIAAVVAIVAVGGGAWFVSSRTPPEPAPASVAIPSPPAAVNAAGRPAPGAISPGSSAPSANPATQAAARPPAQAPAPSPSQAAPPAAASTGDEIPVRQTIALPPPPPPPAPNPAPRVSAPSTLPPAAPQPPDVQLRLPLPTEPPRPSVATVPLPPVPSPQAAPKAEPVIPQSPAASPASTSGPAPLGRPSAAVRCSEITERVQLGEDLTPEDRSHLQKECTRARR